MYRLISLFGMLILVGIAFLISNNKKKISFRILILGITLQVFFALIILPSSPFNLLIKKIFSIESAPGEVFFSAMNDAVMKLLSFAEDGSRFVFGNLVSNSVPVMMPSGPEGAGALKVVPGMVANTGAYFAFNVLPTIIFFSSLMAVLYYLGIMERIVSLFSRSIVIATYALCGFANFSSIAIQIGGLGGIAPKRRHDLARIGFKAMIGGTLAAFMTGTIAGIFL